MEILGRFVVTAGDGLHHLVQLCANHVGYGSDSAVSTQTQQGVSQGVFTAEDIKLFAERAGHLQQGHARPRARPLDLA